MDFLVDEVRNYKVLLNAGNGVTFYKGRCVPYSELISISSCA